MITFELALPHLLYNLATGLLITVLILNLASLFGNHPYLELSTHFRLQYALASLACIFIFILFRSWTLLLFAAAALLFNLRFILPYYFAVPSYHNQTATVHFRLIQVNVLRSNKNYGALIDAVREAHPDVIVMQEFTLDWLEHTAGFISDYPYYKAVPRPLGAGMAIFSRYPLEEATVLSVGSPPHLAILAKANVNGIMVSILSLHPPLPLSSDRFLNRNRQFKEAASIVRATKGPWLLVGDLNTTMWSPYFKDLLRESGLRDARLGFGLKPSWPMPLAAFLQLPIDHCLVSSEVSVEGIRTGGRTGSDHRPLLVDVQLNGKPSKNDSYLD
jgi:endonuclease/exonuclease/phosphatase (EEP) superfamily protein YafD